MSCSDTLGRKLSEADGPTLAIDGDVVLIGAADSKTRAALAFVDATTALFVIGPAAATKESVLQVAAGNGDLATSSAFAATLQYINTDDSLWMMLGEQSPLLHSVKLDGAGLADVKLGTFYLSLNRDQRRRNRREARCVVRHRGVELDQAIRR